MLLLSGLGMVEAEAETDAGTESMFIGGGGSSDPSRSQANPRHSSQQHNRHAASFALASDNCLAPEPHDIKPKHPVIADK